MKSQIKDQQLNVCVRLCAFYFTIFHVFLVVITESHTFVKTASIVVVVVVDGVFTSKRRNAHWLIGWKHEIFQTYAP